MSLKKIAILALCSLLYCSCSSDSFSDLEEFDTNQTVTYTNQVKSIIDMKCNNCHGSILSNGAPMSLVTFDQVKEAVVNRGLLDRISRVDGATGAMPLGGPRLPQNEISILNQWSTDGLLE